VDLPRRRLPAARHLARGRCRRAAVNDGNLNAATVRFLVDGAPMPQDAAAYQRIVLVFNGEDDDAVAAARGVWSDAKTKGFDVTYWQPDEQGRWTKKA
jgi:DNA polymerase-3 subunit chi